jgi:hypothetical protein
MFPFELQSHTRHHVYFEVKGTPWPKSRVRSIYYDFRCEDNALNNSFDNDTMLYCLNIFLSANALSL